ncbi:class I SAM-dependent methyltransferase [Bacillus sp. FJAT-27445]|uniref:class I SAM-dependent DNA methyltransferase n=1 Tax=Bacillus sp. FJAT-27445 TaxID=1679166 RepID=UPI0007439357|nr:class I SAM-dependent methyltransferase [Bacillus sp. FJAT-27445]
MKQFFEEYKDATLYDKENHRTPELEFLKRLAEDCEGPIIDVACGTGRITVPLAMAGHELIGVDAEQEMLQLAEEKSKKANLPIAWIKQDCRMFDAGLKTSLIYSVGNSFQHFLTNEDQDGLLGSVSRHLEEGGLFVFDTRFPSAEELLQPPTEEYWTSYTDGDTGQKVKLSTISHYDGLEQIQYYTTFRKFIQNGAVVRELKTRVNLRYVYPKEVERLMEKHHFKIMNVFSDWNGSPLQPESYAMVYVCKKVVQP